MARRTVTTSSANMVRNPASALWTSLGIVNALSTLVSEMLTTLLGDGVLASSSTPGFSIDATAQDVETDNTVVFRHKGQVYSVSAVAALDISAAATCAGDVITNNKLGAFWAFLNTAGALDVAGSKATPHAYTSAIAALAQWAVGAAASLVPPGTDDVCIGALTVAPTWGDHTMGTTVLTTVGVFYDCIRKPSMEVAAASFALDTGAATFTYGAGVGVLGSWTRITLTGKANVALPAGTAVADKKFGVWLFYALADDTEYALQLGAAYASLQAAKDAIWASSPNPLLVLVGTIILHNQSGAVFTPATTKLDASGISVTFTVNGPGADAIEVVRAQLHQPFTAPDDVTTYELGMPS